MVANSDPTPAPGRMQRTLKDSVEYKGVGLHSGKEIKIIVRPAEAGTGVTFVRTDLDSQPVVRAHGANMKARQAGISMLRVVCRSRLSLHRKPRLILVAHTARA